jgi:hypothetical protein
MCFFLNLFRKSYSAWSLIILANCHTDCHWWETKLMASKKTLGLPNTVI